MGYFLPFYPTNNPKNQNFTKMKKAPRDIITLPRCTKNYDQMMYSWDMMHDGETYKQTENWHIEVEVRATSKKTASNVCDKFMELSHKEKVKKGRIRNLSIIVSCFILQGWTTVVFNMQWGSLKVFLTILRAVESHQMHTNIF